MCELKALLFDVDGTLADTERNGHRIAFNRAFRAAGLDWDWSEDLYGELLAVTGGKERIRHYLQLHRPDFQPPGDLGEFIAGLHAAKTRIYTAMLEEGVIPLRPGVERLLREARKEGLRLAVATTTTPANVIALIRSTLSDAAVDWFDVIAAGDVVPHKKPAPDIYVWAMQRLGLGPEQCLALEDSHNGIRAVRDAGIRSLVVTVNGYTRNENLEGAALVLEQLGEPGQPARLLYGPQVFDEYLDVAALRRLHHAIGNRARP